MNIKTNKLKNKIYICSDIKKTLGKDTWQQFINDCNNPEFKYVIKYPKINKFNLKKIIE